MRAITEQAINGIVVAHAEEGVHQRDSRSTLDGRCNIYNAFCSIGGTKENVLAVFADYEIDIYQHARGSRAPTK
jgi:hypothetical protein